MPLTSVLRRWRPEDQKFRANLGCLEPPRTGLGGVVKPPFHGGCIPDIYIATNNSCKISYEIATKLISWLVHHSMRNYIKGSHTALRTTAQERGLRATLY